MDLLLYFLAGVMDYLVTLLILIHTIIYYNHEDRTFNILEYISVVDRKNYSGLFFMLSKKSRILTYALPYEIYTQVFWNINEGERPGSSYYIYMKYVVNSI